MKQKTAMQDLIDNLEGFVKDYDGYPLVKRGINVAIIEAKDKLEK